MNIYPFVNALTQRLNDYKNRMGYTHFDQYGAFATEGKKYFKVFRVEHIGAECRNKSIVCFIDKITGDIYKPATFAAPAKHPRGNVNSAEHGMEAIDQSGFVIYLK